MAHIVVSQLDWPGTLPELQARCSAFVQARADHAQTEGLPAPREEPLIEMLVFGGYTFELFVPEQPEDPVQARNAANASATRKRERVSRLEELERKIRLDGATQSEINLALLGLLKE